MTRWGVRFLSASRPDDHVEPDWLGLALRAFARTTATPERRFELRPYSATGEAVFRVGGGSSGTHEIEDERPVDVSIRAPVMVAMGLMSGGLPIAAALENEDVQVEGDSEAISDLADLFEMNL